MKWVPLLSHFTEAERNSNLAQGPTARKWRRRERNSGHWLQSPATLNHILSHVTGLLPSMALSACVCEFTEDGSHDPLPLSPGLFQALPVAGSELSWGGWRKILASPAVHLVGRKVPSCSCKGDVPLTHLLKNKKTKPFQELRENYFTCFFWKKKSFKNPTFSVVT